jgi:hypothetical protein
MDAAFMLLGRHGRGIHVVLAVERTSLTGHDSVTGTQ